LVGLVKALSFGPRACPVCGSASQSLVHRQQFERFGNGSPVESYDVVFCDQCGACFASGLPAQSRFDYYYQSSSKYDLAASGAVPTSYDMERYASLVEFVAQHVSDRTGNVLDVGTAAGGFLLALRELGFTSLLGVDPSPYAIRVARHAHTLDVTIGDLEKVKRRGEEFGLISFIAVLEHLLDPATTVKAAVDILTPNGVVLVQVPDANGFADHIDAPYQEFSIEHINYFTSTSLRNLMASQGLIPVVERSRVFVESRDTQAPVIEALFQRSPCTAIAPEKDTGGPQALRAYIARCESEHARICAVLAELAESRRPLYVWGTGTHTLRLLKTSPLSACNIAAFVDSNPGHIGSTLAGRRVLAPTDVGMNAPILVSSATSQTEIVSAARRLYGDDVPLILLYPR
jgi:2-polyprenyl-3-methyl-5-hydroxy-6-metoxy-1,4-benzoquinol methylase